MALRCMVTCEMPEIGAFKVGDIITDEKLVATLTGHPHFAEVAEAAQESKEDK